MTTLTEDFHAGAFIVSEANGSLSREAVTIDTGDLKAGTVLGKITVGTATAAHVAGGTGNSTFSAVAVGAAAIVGVYQIIFTAATKANIEDPNGVLLGVITLGAEFTGGGLTFTITAGGTAHVANDRATITVAAGSGKYVQFNQDATNGSQHAAGILFAPVDATSADQTAVAIVRQAEVAAAALVWPADIEAAEKTAALAELAALNIIAR